MDSKDKQILKILEDNSRLSLQKIAKLTNIPITTVYNRLKRLRSGGIIKKFTVEYDYEKLGQSTIAYILAKINYSILKKNKIFATELANSVIRQPGVIEANLITGEFDLMIKFRSNSTKSMNKFVINYLRQLPEIESTQTIVVMHEPEIQ